MYSNHFYKLWWKFLMWHYYTVHRLKINWHFFPVIENAIFLQVKNCNILVCPDIFISVPACKFNYIYLCLYDRQLHFCQSWHPNLDFLVRWQNFWIPMKKKEHLFSDWNIDQHWTYCNSIGFNRQLIWKTYKISPTHEYTILNCSKLNLYKTL